MFCATQDNYFLTVSSFNNVDIATFLCRYCVKKSSFKLKGIVSYAFDLAGVQCANKVWLFGMLKTLKTKFMSYLYALFDNFDKLICCRYFVSCLISTNELTC